MTDSSYLGLLAIGDPHLASRVPGFRKDDYPHAVLDKLRWCVDYAQKQRLLPCLLGDLFHWPRDNANWLLGEVLGLLTNEMLGIWGNHDCTEDSLNVDDSLSVIVQGSRLRLLDETTLWSGAMNGRPVIVGGTPWGQRLPNTFEANAATDQPLVFWLTHHDILFPGYEESGRFKPFEISGIDVVINGHIHRPLADVVSGSTTWLNPGNIARISRSDSTRQRIPHALRIDVDANGWRQHVIEIPHQPFDDVFHAELLDESLPANESAFVQGLAELMSRRTQSGAGLQEFLEQNLSQFDNRVADEIRILSQEMLTNG
ncbi:MAG: metallophosphoesterase family protein [Planctomycetales bacterium]|nr:metallophosphoesterase family protein [Planctomycetales bacterium]